MTIQIQGRSIWNNEVGDEIAFKTAFSQRSVRIDPMSRIRILIWLRVRAALDKRRWWPYSSRPVCASRPSSKNSGWRRASARAGDTAAVRPRRSSCRAPCNIGRSCPAWLPFRPNRTCTIIFVTFFLRLVAWLRRHSPFYGRTGLPLPDSETFPSTGKHLDSILLTETWF